MMKKINEPAGTKHYGTMKASNLTDAVTKTKIIKPNSPLVIKTNDIELIDVAMKRNITIDEFDTYNDQKDKLLHENLNNPNLINKTALRTGRQRKRTAARTKGGEFQAKRRKRRIYFCCISSDIDVEKLSDEFQHQNHFGMKGNMYDEVLHLYIDNIDTNKTINNEKQFNILEELPNQNITKQYSIESTTSEYIIDESSSPVSNNYLTNNKPISISTSKSNLFNPLINSEAKFKVNYNIQSQFDDYKNSIPFRQKGNLC